MSASEEGHVQGAQQEARGASVGALSDWGPAPLHHSVLLGVHARVSMSVRWHVPAVACTDL